MELRIRKGQTLPLTITNDDITAVTVQILVSDENDNILINKTASFADVDGVWTAYLELSDTDTDIAVGEYKYMFKIVYSDDTIDLLPNADTCDDCDLPIFTVCESLSE